MDVDVEAMLEAPYQNDKVEPTSNSHREHGEHEYHEREYRDIERRERDYRDRDYRDRDYRDRDHRDYRYYRDDDRRSRYSDHHRSSRSPSRHRSHGSPSRHSRRYRRSSRSISRERRHEYRRRRSLSRHRSRSPERQSSRNSRSHASAERSPSPEVSNEDRDRRTVFVTQLAARLSRREFEDFFAQAGKVREAKIIIDRKTGKSKGAGYVEFYDENSVQNALALSGHKLLGIPVLVSLSEAEKNRLAAQNTAAMFGSVALRDGEFNRIYVGSIHFSLTEDDIRQIFEPFGPLDFVTLHKDLSTGRSKGFAFIQYRNPLHAKEALEKMNGFELAGRNIKVGLVSNSATNPLNPNINLDDNETEGVILNSLSRVELMAKLAARELSPPPTTKSTAQAQAPKPWVPEITTRFVMLKNMFNPAEETEPDWVNELEEDIKGECEKYGEVHEAKVIADSMGEVFIKFDGQSSAKRAIRELNGRWFGGRQITAAYVTEAIFDANTK